MAERFAVYYAPSATSHLWERASTWLGRDSQNGEFYTGPVAGIDRSRLLDLTQSANRYGFHATLKAPMTLVDGATEADLRARVANFVPQHQPIDLGRLKLANIGGFLALVLSEPNEALQDFAAHVVEEFDVLRAPMTMKDRAARLAKGLSERQTELLDGYGYPYVFEEFQFHMTLTDQLAPEDADEIMSAAQTWFGRVLDEPVTLDRLAVFHEPDAGKTFRRAGDYKLGQSPA
jgi:putative phosphonate metabolism protein